MLTNAFISVNLETGGEMKPQDLPDYFRTVLEHFPAHDPQTVFDVLMEINKHQLQGFQYVPAVWKVLKDITDHSHRANNKKGMIQVRAILHVLENDGIDISHVINYQEVTIPKEAS